MMQDPNQGKKQTNEQQPLHYFDFNLRFGSYNEIARSFKVWVEGETPGGSMKPDDAVQHIYESTIFWKDSNSGKGSLLDELERRKLNKEDLFTLGKTLTDLALPDGIIRNLFLQSLATLKQDEGLRLRLHIDPIVLVNLPWEFMSLPQASGEPKPSDFLALRREISLVRTDTVEAAVRPLPNRNKARVVAVFSSPRDQRNLEVDDDKQAIKQAIQALNQVTKQSSIEVVWVENPATREAMEKVLSNGTDIFHFAGHATFDTFTSEGQIILEKANNTSDFYSSELLGQLLRNTGVRIAVLGACETGRRDSQNIWSSVASALTREKVPAVVANQFKIKDDNAILIAEKVYHRLLSGYTVDEALFEARQAIYQHSGLEKRDWGTPVLYLGDQKGVLFPRPETDQADLSLSSPFIHVTNAFKEVSGKVVDVEIGKVTRGRVHISDTIDVVKEGGTFTSLKIDEL